MAIDATVGGEDSNSYVTEAEADAYFATHLYASAWESVEKEAALIMATRVLDANVCLVGVPASADQALQWPRVGMVDRGGFAIAEDVIPAGVKYAQLELALNLATVNTTVASDIVAQGITKIKAGPVELGFAAGSVSSFSALGPNVTSMLVSDWLCSDKVAEESNGLIFETD